MLSIQLGLAVKISGRWRGISFVGRLALLAGKDVVGRNVDQEDVSVST